MKKSSKILIVVLVCICALGGAICIGSVAITPIEVIQVIGNRLFSIPLPIGFSNTKISVLWGVRIPRAICAFLVGAALSVSGSVMQSILRNPLASSYTLGVSSGASLGAALVVAGVIQLPFSTFISLPLSGFVFGLMTVLMVIAFTRKLDQGLHNNTVILVGMVLGLFVNAILTLLNALIRENMQQLLYWQMGSFSSRGWRHVTILLPVVIIVTIIISRYGKEMDMLTFGEEQANSMGVDSKNIKYKLFILSAILTGVAVCFTGTIGFVDLIAPHVVRKVFGPKHNVLIPMAAVLGGAFMMIADTIARSILAPLDLPVGAITALIGAPFFAWIYFYKGKAARR